MEFTPIAVAAACASGLVMRRLRAPKLAAQAARGAFIVFEGIDRCGKTTQSETLVEKLRSEGVEVCHMRFPDRTTQVGTMINAYLTGGVEIDDAAVHLLFAANRWEARSEIMTKLNAGCTIVCDRYSFSGVVFTAAKGTLSREWCMAPEVGLPAPDLVLYLDLTVEDAMQRGSFGEERYEREDMQRKVHEIFTTEFTVRPRWTAVDAKRAIDAIQADVQRLARAEVAKQADAATAAPIGKLWE